MNRLARSFRSGAAAVALWYACFGVGNFFIHLDDGDHNDAIYEQVDFWSLVEGGGVNSPSPENRLARDLADRLGPDDPDATELPEEIIDFRGTSNAYGGVTEAIGVDPFSGAGCDECGPLSDDSLNALLLIKQGRQVELYQELQTDLQDTDWNMTWYGDTPLVPFTIIYFLSASGGSYLLASDIPQMLRRRKQDKLVQRHFPEQYSLIKQTDDFLCEDDDDEIRSTRDKLWWDLATQANLIEHGDKSLWDEEKIKRDLADASEVIELRAKVRDSL